MREHVVAEDELRGEPLSQELLRRLAAEEGDLRRDAALDGLGGDVRGRLHTEDGHAALDEPLQQVAVVARELHDLAFRAEPEPLDDHLDVGLRVAEPALRGRGEVGVVAEDLLGARRLRQLDEQALGADVDRQRVERLGLRQVLGPQVRVGQGRAAQVGEHVLELRAARAAGGAGYQVFHRGLPLAHCSSSTILSRRLSMFCQYPSCR